MILGNIACALGRHSVDRDKISRVQGHQVGRCKRCSTALEATYGESWMTVANHDAGLGPRGLVR